jgi:lysophospholipase L1-like esterase
MDFAKSNMRLPLRVSSNLLTYSAWMSDRLRGFPDLSQGDNLTSSRWWHHTIQAQIRISQGQAHKKFLFGDSISSGLGNTLGQSLFNFAIGGLSSISLVEQLKILSAASLKHSHAIIAIGTNDALYGTSNQVISQNVRQAINLVRSMDATRIILVGAFYATHRASKNAWLAGPNQRINEINHLLERVAYEEQAYFVLDQLRALFHQGALNPQFTRDGVHLNVQGKYLYEQILLNALKIYD